ncbi:MAG: DNA-protecting protein DprA, partial [Candidatus Levybacteria bacterium CG10_big_fil_rev_8_21_14_0_10_36_7]
MDERFYYLGFSAFPGIGPRKFEGLLKYFGSAKEGWNADQSDLKKVLGENLGSKLEDFRKKFSIEEYAQKLKDKNVWFVTINDKEYPELLKQIKRPPFLLYGKGQKFHRTSLAPVIAIVGTRKITSYGRHVTEMFTKELVDAGFTIVSGMAMGVDCVSHKTAIENAGKTIAVLGSGV